MSETISDAELIRNVIAAHDQEASQTKINRHLKRFVIVRVVIPVIALAAVTYIASRLVTQDDEEDTPAEEN
jgi:hypothetical protein